MLTYVKTLQWSSSKPQEDAFRKEYSKQGIKVSVSRGSCSESSVAVGLRIRPRIDLRVFIDLGFNLGF
jgi:hypothetical protein